MHSILEDEESKKYYLSYDLGGPLKKVDFLEKTIKLIFEKITLIEV